MAPTVNQEEEQDFGSRAAQGEDNGDGKIKRANINCDRFSIPPHYWNDELKRDGSR